MTKETRISLKAARVNADLNQYEAAQRVSDFMGIKVSRQRVARYEQHPEETPPAFAMAFSSVYKLPIEDIFFNSGATES